jgi:hypothetical protein
MASEELTNWEVLDWLQKRRAVRELVSKVHSAPVAPAGALLSPSLVSRQREIKWVDHKVVKFLSATPAALQTADSLGALLALFDRKAKAWGILLSEKQKLQLLNAQPRTALDLFLCIDDCPGLDEERQGELAAAIDAIASEFAAKEQAKIAQSRAVATASGRKRDRANSSASLATGTAGADAASGIAVGAEAVGSGSVYGTAVAVSSGQLPAAASKRVPGHGSEKGGAR